MGRVAANDAVLRTPSGCGGVGPGVAEALRMIAITSVSETSTTPAGVFDRCLKVKETTPLERFARDYKVYAPGIGIVEDGPLKLVSHKFVPNPSR